MAKIKYKDSEGNIKTLNNIKINSAKSEDDWQPEPDWWDIDKILEEDTEDYPIKIALLIKDIENSSLITKNSLYKVKTSDGAMYTGNNVTHTWDKTKDKQCSKGYNTRYIIYYSNNISTINCNFPIGTMYIIFQGLNNCTLSSSYFRNYGGDQYECIKYKNCSDLLNLYLGNRFTKKIIGITDELCQNITDCSSMFSDTSMTNEQVNEILSHINFNKVTNLNMAFRELYIDYLDLKNTGNVIDFKNFISAGSIRKIEEVDFNSATDLNKLPFYNCYYLIEIKSIKNIKKSGMNLTNSKLLNHDTLIRILNALYDYSADTENTYTITLGATNLAKLTEEEIAIGTNKGWTIS